MKNITYFFLGILLIQLMSNCSKDEEAFTRLEVDTNCIDVSNANLLSNALIINGKNVTGISSHALENKFQAVENNSNLNIRYGLQSASVSSESTMYLPFFAEANENIAGVFLSVQGAGTYWKIDASNTDGEFILSIDLPCAEIGEFYFEYRIFDTEGNVSESRDCRVRIIPDVDVCGDDQKGSDGLTITSYNPNTTSTQLRFDYQTYSAPDRIDVKYGDDWIFSTGDLLTDAQPYPEIKDCNDVVSGDGFVGQWGSEVFDYDPTSGKRLTVYVSGCLNNSTAWKYSIQCE